jgi:2-succinyl-5-enolpyruvyl-6-hydroxy-3-cyclohexene-1-carboxylate synthase
MWSRQAPIQVNVCFDEPLIDAEIRELDFSNATVAGAKPPPGLQPTQARVADQPVVIAGPMSLKEAEEIRPILEKLGAPIYAEGLSNLRGFESLQNLFLKSGDKIVRELFIKGHALSIIRVGGIPTLRFWRDLEESFQKVPVISLSNADYTGLSRGVKHTVGFHNAHLLKAEWTCDSRSEIFKLDRDRHASLRKLLQKYPRSEVSLIQALDEKTKNQFVYLGNSLPIREWDLVSAFQEGPSRQAGNRGANGIDGQVSSFLGGASGKTENWAVIGDLTAMYDLASLWVTRQLAPLQLRLVIVNNNGGQIFKNMFEKEIFLNAHQTEFSHWAQMWKWDYQKWQEVPKHMDLPQHVVIELVPDSEQTQKFWQEYKSL